MKCNDCGEWLTNDNTSPRSDVCKPCMQTRMDIVSGKTPLTAEQIRGLQKSMANGRGTAKRRVDKLLGANQDFDATQRIERKEFPKW